ncbi:uncharacterized protein CTRU02_212479 [Colletotrichum truncatum]|uniref:Uncharacterized protein n=2 Tax=Colletotrichum truncatum TaxID=5467 RepID=A0ACC3YEK1_COLTU|nr:uncharacterized protein CTRU02_13526 [Colletotrichum truncatum]XP_036584639.1 uncharacterized protein CTRU02_05714 [Colletotrichum truncatum]KAF6783290.1 hypothetical protein CTRU02_13526 [Colletotrichum truncatum]KAF6794157.1 hypothetical protein CTRU02_05714 [Colletotrichum truncatum]
MRVHKGTAVNAAWSPLLDVVEVICTFESDGRVFYGVVTEIPHPFVWDWLDYRQVLWVFDDGDCVKVWQECVDRPRLSNPAWTSCLHSIVGCYETDGGYVLYAVKWDGYACPTWEAEEDMSRYVDLLAEHDQTCKCRQRS